VIVILRLTVIAEHRLVTNGQTDRQRHDVSLATFIEVHYSYEYRYIRQVNGVNWRDIM